MLIGVPDIITQTFRLYRQHPKTVIIFSLLASFAPIALIFVLIFIIGIIGGGSLLITGGLNQANLGPGMILSLMSAIVATAVVTVWINTALIRAIFEIIQSNTAPGILESLRGAKKVLVSALFAPLLASILASWPFLLSTTIFAGTSMLARNGGGIFIALIRWFSIAGMLFSIGFGIYKSVQYFFTVYGAAIDGLHVREAIRQSRDLTHGRWLSMLGYIFGTGLLLICVIIGATIAISIVSVLLSFFPYGDLVSSILSAAVQALCMPTFIIAQVILYTEAKKTTSLSAPPAPIKIA